MKEGITKQHSQMLYGIAILLMLYHHMFAIPERLECEYISVLGNVELKVAWFAKICVAVYAFISGYAACLYALKQWKKELNIFSTFVENGKYAVKRIFFFMKKFWIVYLVFVPMGIMMKYISVDFKEFMKGLFAWKISSYNGEWWYVAQYLLMMSVFPFFDLLVSVITIKLKINRRKFIYFVSSATLIFILLYAIGVGNIREYYWNIRLDLYYCKEMIYLIIFMVGYFVAKYRLLMFDKLKMKPYIEVAIAIIGIIFCWEIRTLLATEAFYSLGDILIVVPFVVSVCVLCKYTKKISKTMVWLGKYSTYMWLSHTFFCYYYFRNFIIISKVSTIMYLQLIVVSLITAIVLEKIEKSIDYLASIISLRLKNKSVESRNNG